MTDKFTLTKSIKSIATLIVDDEEINLHLLERKLRQLGIDNISHASSGVEALALIKTAPELCKLLITDLNMPGMDGIELVRHLSELKFKGSVILLSSSDLRLLDSVANLYSLHKLHLLGLMKKPLDEELLSKLLSGLEDAFPETPNYIPIQLLTANEIRAGIKADCVELFFQPKVAIIGRFMEGVECLLRWRDPQRGVISPLCVIPVAEEHGLIDDLTLLIFKKAVGYQSEWKRQGHNIKVSINFSIKNLQRLDLPDLLLNITRKAGVSPRQLTLEITESCLINHLTTSLEVITRLKLMGFNLSIDDFGTGYASMEVLKLMPFNELKADRSFVHGATTDRVAVVILESTIKLGHALNMQVVAEGAETQEDLDILTSLHCDLVQGYVVAKPMPPEKIIGWKTQWEEASLAPY